MSNYKYHVSTVGMSSFTYTLEGIEYLSGGPEKTIDVLYWFGASNIGKFVFVPGWGFPIKAAYKSPGQLYPDEYTFDSYTNPEFPFFNGPPMVYEGTAELTYTATYTGQPHTLHFYFDSIVQSITFLNGDTVTYDPRAQYGVTYTYLEELQILPGMTHWKAGWSGFTGSVYWGTSSGSMTHLIGKYANGSITEYGDLSDLKIPFTTQESINIYITAVPVFSHTITYKKNDGTDGNFGTQSWSDSNATIVNHRLLTTSPTREKYTFRGWSLQSSQASTPWKQPGEYVTYEGADLTLYALWTKNTIGLFYWDGASGEMDGSIIAANLPVSNIYATRWNRLKAKIAELAAAQGSSWTYSEVQPGDEITAGTALSPGEYRKVRTGISNRTGHGTLPAARSAGDEIIASDFNGTTSLKSALNTAIQTYNDNL